MVLIEIDGKRYTMMFMVVEGAYTYMDVDLVGNEVGTSWCEDLPTIVPLRMGPI